MENDQFRPATKTDADRIMEIIEQAKQQMFREGKRQWDETYPTLRHITGDIEKQYGYVLCHKTQVIAYGAVVFDGEPAYTHIEGKWLSGLPYVVLHRLAVADEMKRKGVATRLLLVVEKLALGKGFHSFKIDTNDDNFAMQGLFRKLGFSYCGKIRYLRGSRMAYEKIL